MTQNFSPVFTSQETEIPSPNPHLYEQIIVNKKKSYMCLAHKCEKVFRFASEIKRHLITHSKAKAFPCQHSGCSKSFKRPDALKLHVQTHNEDFEFICPVAGCDSQFQKKTMFRFHLKKHKVEELLCDFPECGKSLKTIKHLEQHQKDISFPQDLTQKSSNDLDCFFNHFEKDFDVEKIRNRNFDESPEPERFLHVEKGRATCPKKPSANLEDNDDDLKLLMMCKYLHEENKKIKQKLAKKIGSLTAEFEHSLDPLLKKVFDSQFKMNNDGFK